MPSLLRAGALERPRPDLEGAPVGLTGNEGNHGEDVKEDYFYLDSTPTHSYVKSLYKYPQAEFPYARLVAENRHRSREQPEFELADTGVFDEHRYFDVFAEYAKGGPDDLLIRITVHNRGPDTASLHVLPTVWFRNTWAWSADPGDLVRPQIAQPTPRLSWRHTNPSEPFTSPPSQGRTKNCRSSCSPRTKPIPSCSSARRTKAGTPRTPSTTT